MRFVGKNKFTIFGEMFYNDEDAIITDITDGVFELR